MSMSAGHSSSSSTMACVNARERSAEGDKFSPKPSLRKANNHRGRDGTKQNGQHRRAVSSRSDTSSATSHGHGRECARRACFPKPKKSGQSEWQWPGQSPNKEDLDRWETLRKNHETFHTLEGATHSAHGVYDFLKELDGKGTILNMNAMRIALEHIFMKAACFEAADYAVDMMRRHKCRFPVNVVTEIVKAISLRAEFDSTVAPFVRRLVRNTLRHLSDSERAFHARHMAFALAERYEDFREFLARGDSRFEKGLQMDWDSSSAQKFYLYNRSEVSEDGTGPKWYEGQNEMGFTTKDSLCLLSLDLEDAERTGFGHQYHRQVDGAIVQIQSAKEKTPLVVKLLTPVTVPFKPGARYRLYDMGLNSQAVNKLMEALSTLGDSHDIAKQNAAPHRYLMDVLMLPPEEPIIVRSIHLQPKVATLEEELGCWLRTSPEHPFDREQNDAEPIRVRKIGTGAFLAWNQANPNKSIRVGDRIAKVNGAEGKEAILAELRHAHDGWNNFKLDITFMRAVKARDRGIEVEMLERMRHREECQAVEKTTEDILQREYHRLITKLNSSQLEALRVACTRRLALIQGPPGAGKTTTAVEIVCFLLENKIVPTPLLVSGHTNTSVDNLLVRLAKKGKRVVRLGGESNKAKIREECLPYLVDGEKACELGHAEVICATCSGSGSAKLQEKGIYCHTVLIDEGSQATESSCLIPLCHGAQHLIIVGDQCQLEPMVKSGFAKSEQLGTSLFNRLYKQGIVPTMLNTQHRMHPFICEFPSAAFYDGQLLTGVKSSDRLPSKYWQWPSPTRPVCFVDVSDGCEASTGDKIVNEVEAALVQKAVLQLLKDADMKQLGDDGTYPIAVITGYAAQKELIKKQLINSGLGGNEDKDKCLVEVNTVDAFQGREKAVIIFSAVRANHEIGFLRDWRRLNVMLTRARNGLIVFGHRETLQLDYFWGNWLRWASENGCIMGEIAKGKWKPKCLLPEEWTLKIGDEVVQDGFNSKEVGLVREVDPDWTKTQNTMVTCDSWEDSAVRLLSVRTATQTSRMTCDSWEDSASRMLTARTDTHTSMNSAFTRDSWEDYDTPVESNAAEEQGEEESLDGSEPIFYSQSEFTESDVAESGDEVGEDCYGPLERKIQESGHASLLSPPGATEIDSIGMPTLCRSDFGRQQSEMLTFEGDEVVGAETLPATEVSCDGEEDIPAPPSLERWTTGNSVDGTSEFDFPCSSSDSEHTVQWIDDAFRPTTTMLVPVLMHVSCLDATCYRPFQLNPHMQVYTCQGALAPQPPVHAQLHRDVAVLSQHIVLHPTSGAALLHAEWYADSQKLFSNDRSIVSPSIEVSSEVHGYIDKAIPFKVVLRPRGNGFAKSQGIGHVMLRCEGCLDPSQSSFSFTITIGEETYGPVAHNFYAHPTADLPNNPACKFRQAADKSSKKLLVRLEIWSEWEAPEKVWSRPGAMAENSMQSRNGVGAKSAMQSASRLSDAMSLNQHHIFSKQDDEQHFTPMWPEQAQLARGMGRRSRSDIGQQKQYDRWQRRKQERNTARHHARFSCC